MACLLYTSLLTELPIEEIHKHQTDYISLQVDDVTRVAAPVSYTHLDVYKRQILHRIESDILLW